jgi:hypothetical protein
MYYLYHKIPEESGQRYVVKGEISLFGCNVGFIPRMLRSILTPTDSEPDYGWQVNVRDAMTNMEYPDHALVIDLMPNLKSPTLSLYEVVDVWGYSDHGWTPVMLHLSALFDEQDPGKHDRNDFFRGPKDVEDPVFSMTYLKGSVLDGKLQGTWNPPGPSSTNSVLLWPKVFDYFADNRKRILPIKA